MTITPPKATITASTVGVPELLDSEALRRWCLPPARVTVPPPIETVAVPTSERAELLGSGAEGARREGAWGDCVGCPQRSTVISQSMCGQCAVECGTRSRGGRCAESDLVRVGGTQGPLIRLGELAVVE